MIIKKSQVDSFKVPVRKKNREQMLLQLKAKGYKVSDEGNRDIAITDSKGNKTRLVFDENYIARKIIKPSGLEYSFEFDDADNLSKLVFPGNEFIGMGYEKDLLKSLSLNNNRISLHYDEKQRLTELVTPDGKRNSITYNISNQAETLTNKAGETKRFETNIKDNRLLYSLRDSLGRVTKIDTDPLGSGDEIIFADGSRETTVYDEDLDAFVTTLRNGAKKVTYYEENSPSRVEWDDGNFLNLELDEQQQIKQLENPSGTISFNYDDQGRIIEEAFQGNKVSYVYDEDGLLTRMVYPSGLVVAYDYDEDGRLKSINAGGHVCSYTYGDNDTVAKVQYPNGIKEQRKQQVLGGITESVLLDATGQTVTRQSYRYDNLNRLTQYRSSDKSRPQKEKSWELSYDAEDRLLSNIESQSGKVERFTYDHKGNLASAHGNTVKVGAMDEVVSINSQNVFYDSNGNVTRFVNKQGKVVELKFSHNNELKFARVNNQTWEYWYDGTGRRVGKSNGRDAHKFFWGSEKLLAEEIKTSQGTENRQYIYGHNGSVPVGFVEGTNCFWLHADARGAVTHLSDQQGNILWSADYSSFGEAILFNSSVNQPFRLTGQYADDETGLHYSTARYYSPILHQFISLDPKWLEHGASNYNYALNDPFNKIDVDGNLADWVAAGIGMAAGIAVGMAVAAAMPVAAAGAAGVLAFMAVGALAGALGDGIASMVENKAKGEEICVPCALKAAGMGALFGAVGGPIGKLLGKALRPVGKRLALEYRLLRGSMLLKKLVPGKVLFQSGRAKKIFKKGTKLAELELENGKKIDIKVDQIYIPENPSGKVVIIGRNMKNVDKAAKELEKKGYVVEILDSKSLSKTNSDGDMFTVNGKHKSFDQCFDDLKKNPNYPRDPVTKRVPNDKLPETDMYKANMEWVERSKKDGSVIIDTNNPDGWDSSAFYDGELKNIPWSK